jgi:LDH2 family malate/lactate/ureidoglycolate dehydrogenase
MEDGYMAAAWEPFDKIERFMADAFVKAGVPEDDAKICADVLIESDKRGIDSHGCGRFKPIYLDRIKAGIQNPVTRSEIVREGCTTAVVDGHDGMGMVVGNRCMRMAIDKAGKYGMGMVVARNSTHFGIAGYYASMAVKNDMIGIIGTNARPSIAPTFGVENMLGTNPITFGMPTDEDFPFMLDCATSTTQRGTLEVYEREGRELPSGWVIGSDGNIRTDTVQVLKDLTTGAAALSPVGGVGDRMAGYKGYGYATAVEILSSALQAGSYLRMLTGIGEQGEPVPHHLGHFFIAINVSEFIEPEEFKKRAGNILRELRASRKAPGCDRIYTAGEKEYLMYLERRDKGVPLNEAMQKILIQVRDEYDLPQYRFSFE